MYYRFIFVIFEIFKMCLNILINILYYYIYLTDFVYNESI